MSYIHSIQAMLDTDIQNTSGVRILVRTNDGLWQDEYSISTDVNLGGSDLVLATQSAIKAYIDNNLLWSANSYGVYTVDSVAIGVEPNISTEVYKLFVEGDIRGNNISVASEIKMLSEKVISWASGRSTIKGSSDNSLHLDSQSGIKLLNNGVIKAQINEYGLGVGTPTTYYSGVADNSCDFRSLIAKIRELSIGLDESAHNDESLHVYHDTFYDKTMTIQGMFCKINLISYSADATVVTSGLTIGPSAVVPFPGGLDSRTDLGKVGSPFSTFFTKQINFQDEDLDSEIKNITADKDILIKTTGKGKVKLNKAVGFQLTQMDGGELDISDSYVTVGRQIIPPEMEGLKLVGVYISCAYPGDQDLYIHVTRTPGNSTSAVYNNLILEDSAVHHITDPFTVSTGKMIYSPIVHDMDGITISARYSKIPVTPAKEVVVTLMFDLP